MTLHRLQRAIDFVEGRLMQDFTLDDVAQAAGLSRYHLHRVFSAAFGDTLKGYIRKRRLSEAARQLRDGDRRIIELAVQAGFGSQEAFTRAFSRHFGVTPGSYRRHPASRKRPGLQRVDTAVIRHRRDGVSHSPRIIERDADLVVRGRGIGLDFEDDAPVIALWAEILPTIARGDTVLYGVTQSEHPDIPKSPEQCLIYVAGQEGGAGVVEICVPPGRYAVFDHHGPVQRMVDTVTFAWASWLLQSAFDKSDRPDIERFVRADVDAQQPHIELWVSIDEPQ